MPEGVEAASLEEALQRADYVSIHCPLNDSTRGLIGEAQLALMKPAAYLINTARGGVVDQTALIAALKSGRISGAALDVQELEPPPDDDPIWTCPNLVLTPHIGWKRKETRQRLADMVAANVAAFLAGSPINVVAAPPPAAVHCSRLKEGTTSSTAAYAECQSLDLFSWWEGPLKKPGEPAIAAVGHTATELCFLITMTDSDIGAETPRSAFFQSTALADWQGLCSVLSRCCQ